MTIWDVQRAVEVTFTVSYNERGGTIWVLGSGASDLLHFGFRFLQLECQKKTTTTKTDVKHKHVPVWKNLGFL